MLALGEDYPELRESVRKICEKYPGAYWRKLEDEQAYPTEFVDELTAGRVSRLADPGGIWRLRPAVARRRGDPRRDQRLGLHRQPGPRPDVHHGHPAAARQRGAEAALSAEDRVGRIAPAGVRRHRADHRLRHDQAEDPRGARRQRRPLRRQRPEGVDLARAAVRSDAAAGAHDAGRGGQAPHRRAVGVPGRSAREPRQRARNPADRGDDQPQHQRGVLRQSRRCRPRT